MAVAHQLQEAFERVGADCERVLVDLTSCEFIDSTGIATLVQTQQLFANEGRRLMVCAPHAQVLRVFEVTGLMNGRGLVFESAEAALLGAI